MRDFANSVKVLRAISPAAAITDNTVFTSQIIDKSGYDKLMFAISTGSLADSDATFTALVEHGNDPALGDAVAAPDASLTGSEADASFTFAHDDSVRKIGYVGSKRYVRLKITPANNTGNAFVSAVAILSGSRFNPPA